MAIIFFTISRTQIADLRYSNESESSKTQSSLVMTLIPIGFGSVSAQHRYPKLLRNFGSSANVIRHISNIYGDRIILKATKGDNYDCQY